VVAGRTLDIAGMLEDESGLCEYVGMLMEESGLCE